MNPFINTPCIPASPAPKFDLIFVLAGLESRKAFGLRLFRERAAPGILLSVGRFELRKFPRLNPPLPIDLLSLADSTPPPERHFFVSFESGTVSAARISIGRFGTLSEISALAGFLRQKTAVRSVLLISSAVHLPRVGLCCRFLLPTSVRFRLAAAPPPDNRERNSAARVLRLLLESIAELIKLPVYCLLLLAGAGRLTQPSAER